MRTKLLPIFNTRNQVVGYKQADDKKRRRRRSRRPRVVRQANRVKT